MEGSVQNLLNAENEAKEIVNEARKLRDTLAKNAEGKAQQELNNKQRKWQQKLDDENQNVSGNVWLVAEWLSNFVMAYSWLKNKKTLTRKLRESTKRFRILQTSLPRTNRTWWRCSCSQS